MFLPPFMEICQLVQGLEHVLYGAVMSQYFLGGKKLDKN